MYAKSRVQAVQERRRSNAAGAHRPRTDRAVARRSAIADSRGES